jgi:hypothetical protein
LLFLQFVELYFTAWVREKKTPGQPASTKPLHPGQMKAPKENKKSKQKSGKHSATQFSNKPGPKKKPHNSLLPTLAAFEKASLSNDGLVGNGDISDAESGDVRRTGEGGSCSKGGV